MPILRIRAFGLSPADAEELGHLLKRFDDVEEVDTHNSADDLQPGVIYASALHITYLITFALSAGGAVVGNMVGGAAKEMGKDLYLAAKERLQQRIADWKAEKDMETPERIHLVMDDQGEMHISPSER